MYQLREPHPTISTIAASQVAVHNSKDSGTSNPTSGTYHSISDIDDIMDLLALPSADNSTATNATNNDASASVSANDSRIETTSSATSTLTTALAAPVAVNNTSSTSTVHRTPALFSARTEIPVLPTPPAQPRATMADLEFDDLLLPPLQLGSSTDATQNDSIGHPSSTTVGNDNSKFGTLTLDPGSQQDLDDFFKELTIHTPVSVHNSGAVSPIAAAATSCRSQSNNNSQADVFDVLGSDVLVPHSVANTNSGPTFTMPSTFSTNSNMSTSNQGLLGLQSTSAPSLNNLTSAPSVRSQSNNAISSINIGTSVTTVNKPTNELFNDLLLTSMPTTVSSTKRVTPAVAVPITNSTNSTNSNTVGGTAASVGAAGTDKIVRTPALLSSSSTVPNSSTAGAPATDAAPSAVVKLGTQSEVPVPPTPVITSADTKVGVSAQNNTAAMNGNANPGPTVATASEATPAPAKKSLGGNIQVWLCIVESGCDLSINSI